jgi:hypothetical protein
VYAIGGYSVTVGRGVLAAESWPALLEQLLTPVFGAGTVPLVVRNMASGGTPSFPFGWCMPEVFGPEATLVAWQFSMNEPGNRCNLAAELYARSAFSLPSQPLLLIVDENPRRIRALTETYAAFGAHAINLRAALPGNQSGPLPWGLTVGELMQQGMAPGCQAAKHHPGWRHHRMTASAIARLHLRLLVRALGTTQAERHRLAQDNRTALPLPPLACTRAGSSFAPRQRRAGLACGAITPTVAPPSSFASCRLLTEPRFVGEAADLLALVRSPVATAGGRLHDKPPTPNAPWPPASWVSMLNPHDIAPTRVSQRCGSNYGDRKYTLVGSAAAGWLRMRVPYPQAVRGGWPLRYSALKLCRGGKATFEPNGQRPPVPAPWPTLPVSRAHGAIMVCSSPGVPKAGQSNAHFGNLFHQPLIAPSTAVEWELNGAVAIPVAVHDEYDAHLAIYLEHPLCVAFALPITPGMPPTLELGLRILTPGTYATVDKVLWS